MTSPRELSRSPYALESSVVYEIKPACGRKVAHVTAEEEKLSLHAAHERRPIRAAPSRKEARKK
jgi:hypothetical protein